MIRKHGKIILLALIFVTFTGITGYSYGKLQGVTIEKEKIVSKEAQEKKIAAEKAKKEKAKKLAEEKAKKDSLKAKKNKPEDNKKNKDRAKRERPSTRSSAPAVSVGQASEHLSSNVSTPGNLKDGEYIGSSQAYGGPIKLKVKISAGKIRNIEVLDHSETPSYYSRAYAVLGRIISAQSLRVDSVSGATVTSEALKVATYNALKMAEGSGKTLNSSDLNLSTSSGVQQKDLDEIKHMLQILLDNEKEDQELGEIQDGVFQGKARGYKSEIRVELEIKDKKISNIKILSHNEDQKYFSKAKKVLEDIIKNQSTKVDMVAGATLSSRGIKSAVYKALRKAEKTQGSDDSTEKDLMEQIKVLEQEIKEKDKVIQEQVKKIKELLDDKNPLPQEPPVVDDEITVSESKKNGTWQAEAMGHKGIVKVEVKTKDGKIEDLNVLKQSDDGLYFLTAMQIKDLLLKDDFLGTLKVFRKYAQLTDMVEDKKIDQLPSKLQAQILGWTIPNREPVDTTFTEKLSKEIRDYMIGEDSSVGPQFDAVSGATRTAKGISEAVRKAITEEKNSENERR